MGEMELEKVQIDLESANECSLSESLEAREAHIRELEEQLFAKDKEVIFNPFPSLFGDFRERHTWIHLMLI